MNYSLRQLRIFVTVAHARSFSRAGEMIGLSQSAVSHSVKELENQTGVRLLDRTTREVVLTEAGQQLALRLERLLDELNSTLRDVGRLGQQLSGTVRVAASQTISAHLIPQCIAEGTAIRTLILSCMTGRSSGCWRASARGCGFWYCYRSRPGERSGVRKRAFGAFCCSAVTTIRWPRCRSQLAVPAGREPGFTGLCLGQPSAD
jgi:DNA-binding transcriptional LysR family regulator